MSTRRMKLTAVILTFCQAIWGDFVNVTTTGCYPNTLCEIECDPGYHRVNRDPWCRSGGGWYDDMSTVCVKAEEFCPYPIPNGYLRGCDRTYRDPEVLRCDVKCNSGYYRDRSMSNVVTCEKSLEWQTADPESRRSRSRSLFTTHPDTWCIRKGGGVPICTVDPLFEIDHDSCDTTSRGQCLIKCPYNLDRMWIKCLDTGEWDKDLSHFCPFSSARCSRDVLDGYIDLETGCDTSAGSKCSFTCPSGTVFNVDRYGVEYYGTVRCLNDGLWYYESTLKMRPDDACIGTDSVSFCPSTIENGSLEPGCLHQEGATCKYHCDEGYYAVSDERGRGTGIRKTECDANGTWRRRSCGHYYCSYVATEQLCQVNTPCPEVPHGMLLNKDRTPLTSPAIVGEYYLFGCDNGYIRDRGALSIDCTEGGKWKINHVGDSWDRPQFSEICFEPTNGGLQTICPDSIPNGHLVS